MQEHLDIRKLKLYAIIQTLDCFELQLLITKMGFLIWGRRVGGGEGWGLRRRG